MTTSPFLGRDDELHRLHALIAGARNHVGGSLLVHGDPGVGKSTLLAQAAGHDAGVRMMSLTGFEVESHLAYGALQRLGRMLGAQADALPERQRDAVLVAAGLKDGRPPERALVSLATLSLLAIASEQVALVCLIDDAQHLDPETLDVLGFVSRRLSAEGLGLIFAARDDENVARALAGVPAIHLQGLPLTAASRLVRQTLGAALDPAVVAEIVDQTGGNPLALTELAAHGDAHRLTLTTIAGSPLPIGKQLEAHYTAKVTALPQPSRLWLLTAAAESTGDAGVVRSAALRLGIPPEASAEVEAERLVEIHDRVDFRHPLIRSAVYNAATDVERRTVHAALRDETATRGLADFSSWHAASTASGADLEVMQELIDLADRVGARGGQSSRAKLLARAAALCPEAARSGELLVSAAEAALNAGAARLALELLDGVDPEALSLVNRGRLLFARTTSSLFLSDPATVRDGVANMLRAADLFHGYAPELEQRALLLSLNFAQAAERRMRSITVEQLGRRLRDGVDVATGPRAIALRAASSFILDPYEDAVPHLVAATEMLEGLDDAALLEFSLFCVSPTVGLWDPDAAVRLLQRIVRVARETGAIREADSALWTLSAIELTRCNPRMASDCIEQAVELRSAIGYSEEQVMNPALMAWLGTPPEAVEQIAQAMGEAGWWGVSRMAFAALAIADTADGHYQSAQERLSPLVAEPFLQASFHQLVELVEAAVRSGNLEQAESASSQIRRYADANQKPWSNAMAERAAALLAGDYEAEQLYLSSIGHLELTGMLGESGRAHLLYGEWLRRMRRRRDARVQLHQAIELLTRAGAARFVVRARRELEATGEVAELVEAATGTLTSQEAVVAKLAAEGSTNAEIGEALFISRNTVDYHLRKVYRKLGVSSRRQLSDLPQIV